MKDINKENHAAKSMIHYMENNKVKERKVTKVDKIKAELDALEVGDILVKSELIRKYWGRCDDQDYYFLCRSFDVAFLNARKQLKDKKFKTKSGKIERVL